MILVFISDDCRFFADANFTIMANLVNGEVRMIEKLLYQKSIYYVVLFLGSLIFWTEGTA